MLDNSLLITQANAAWKLQRLQEVGTRSGIIKRNGLILSRRGLLRVGAMAAPALILSRAPVKAATNFLEAAGTGGLITSATTVAWVTALASLTNGAATTSSTVFSQTTFANAQKLQGWFINGTASFTPTAGGVLAFWWLLSTDGGTTFETLVSTPSTTVPALPRTPDFLIPFDAAAFASGNIRFAQGPFPYPYLGAKLVMQNLCGATLSTTGTPTVLLGGVADQY